MKYLLLLLLLPSCTTRYEIEQIKAVDSVWSDTTVNKRPFVLKWDFLDSAGNIKKQIRYVYINN